MSLSYKTTKINLYNEIWSITSTRFARNHGISYSSLRKACEKHNIPMPTVGYWRELKKGNSPKIPKMSASENIEIEIPLKNKRKYFDLSSKANTVCILKILEKYSDEKKPLSVNRIITLMEREYMLSATRVTVYDSIEILNKVGYDISTYSDNGQGYYLRSREFDTYEIQIIQDSLAMNPFVPQKIEQEIKQKISKKMSTLNNINFRVIHGIRKRNKSYQRFYYTLEQIDRAKINEKKLTFDYGALVDFDTEIPESVQRFTLTPERVIAENNNYFLRCISENKTDLIYFKINKILNPIVSDQVADKRPCAEASVKMYLIDKPDVLLPRNCFMKLKCNISVLEDAMDFFGNDLKIESNTDKKTYTLSKRVDFENAKSWCLCHLCDCEVTEPTELRAEVIDAIRHNIYKI